MRLPKRLEAVADRVIPGEVAADVGTGHGRLAAALVERGLCPRVIATEVAAGPGEEAARLLAEAGAEGVELRRGWGLAPLQPGEAGVVVLAGLGGPTIVAVLEQGRAVAAATRRLVLQPQNRPEVVRGWLLTHGFALEAEDLVEEARHFYPILVAAPARETSGEPGGGGQEEPAPVGGTTMYAGGVAPVAEAESLSAALAAFGRSRGLPAIPSGLLLEVGPLLAAGRHPVLAGQLERRLAATAELGRTLRSRPGGRAEARARSLGDEMAWLEMIVEWLRQSAP